MTDELAVATDISDSWELTRPIPDEVNSKLTPQRVKTILDGIAAGGYIEQSCVAAGISAKTYRRWLARGEAEPGSVYEEFRELAERAEAAAEARLVGFVQVAAEDPRNWAAAMTMLERRHPNRWGRKDRVHSTVDAVHTLVIQWGDVAQVTDGDED